MSVDLLDLMLVSGVTLDSGKTNTLVKNPFQLELGHQPLCPSVEVRHGGLWRDRWFVCKSLGKQMSARTGRATFLESGQGDQLMVSFVGGCELVPLQPHCHCPRRNVCPNLAGQMRQSFKRAVSSRLLVRGLTCSMDVIVCSHVLCICAWGYYV